MKRLDGKVEKWFFFGLVVLVVYFIYTKAKTATVGGVTATPAPSYGPGSGGLYSQVG